jgi:hypothetical protein
MVTHFADGRLCPYVALTFPLPIEDRPILFDLGMYMRRLDQQAELTTRDIELLEALGYTLCYDETRQDA